MLHFLTFSMKINKENFVFVTFCSSCFVPVTGSRFTCVQQLSLLLSTLSITIVVVFFFLQKNVSDKKTVDHIEFNVPFS